MKVNEIQFDVVPRATLPPDLTGGKYSPLVAAISKLNGKEVICVTAGHIKVGAYLHFLRRKNPGFAEIKWAQRDNKLWIYRGEK